MKRALFSLDNLDNIERYAGALKEMGWHIIATSETVERLAKGGIEAESVANFVGIKESYSIPPTLHPKMEEALTMDVPHRIDLVYDIPYTLEKGMDVGGHTLLALGAKGERIVTFTPGDMEDVLTGLNSIEGHATVAQELRDGLIDKAHAKIAAHYLELSRRADKGDFDGMIGKKTLRLAEGENPYQTPSDLFVTGKSGFFGAFERESAGLPCFTNLADTDAILHTLSLAAGAFRNLSGKVPYIAVAAKHGNPCGMAVDWGSKEEALRGALGGDPLAIWGGEVVVNFEVTDELAAILYKDPAREKDYGSAYWMLDVVAAPGFSEEAIKILGKSKTRKLFSDPALLEPGLPATESPSWQYRQIRGGFLRQPRANYTLDIKDAAVLERLKKDATLDSMVVAWSTAYSSNHGGNEVAIATERRLIGTGGGPSTVAAAKVAVMRTGEGGHYPKGAVFAADAFFPFTDAPEILMDAGCSAGVVPGGGKNESLVKDSFKKRSVEVVFIEPAYRGFCRH